MVWNRSYITKYNRVIKTLRFSVSEGYLKYRFDLLKKNYKTKSTLILKKRWKKFKKYNLFNFIKLYRREVAYLTRVRSLSKINFFYNKVSYYVINNKHTKKFEKYINIVSLSPKIWKYNIFLTKPFILKPNIYLAFNKCGFRFSRFLLGERWRFNYTKRLHSLTYNYLNLIGHCVTMLQLKELYRVNILLRLFHYLC